MIVKIGTHLFGSCGQTRSANIPIGNVEYFAKISDESSAKRWPIIFKCVDDVYKMVGPEPYSIFEQIFTTAVSGYSTGDAVNFRLTTEI